MDAGAVQRVRAFNRTVAERIGALTDGFLGRGRPMGESRTLWEIGLDGTEVRQLRARLGLDSGYTSRVMRSLEQDDGDGQLVVIMIDMQEKHCGHGERRNGRDKAAE